MCVSVFVQGKETTEEEDEVAVGMEKGFMDEFFEQVCLSHSPDQALLSLSASLFPFAHLMGWKSAELGVKGSHAIRIRKSDYKNE